MALTGTFLRSLDEKQRLAIPRALRDELGIEDPGLLYVAPGMDHSVAVYSEAAFQALAARLAEQSPSRSDVRTYLRLFYARAEKVGLDSQGRIRIPERLASFAELRHEVVLLGVHEHMEVWDRESWRRFLEKHNDSFDEMAARAFE